MKNILLLGATGSIGDSVLSVIKQNSNELNLEGIAFQSNLPKALSIIDQFDPNFVYCESKTNLNSIKESIKKYLIKNKLNIEDLGCFSLDPVDYPDYAKLLASKIESNNNSFGLLFCGTGIGISMAANRFSHVRAALCTSVEMASKSRKHNDANVLALGGRILTEELSKEIVSEFLNTKFEEGRHLLRVKKI